MKTENNKKIILYFKDESLQRECMRTELQEAGYVVFDFGDTRDAWEYVKNKTNKIDGAIIDKHLANSLFSGDDLIDKIFYKMQVRNKNSPLISVSGWLDKPQHSTVHFDKRVEDKLIIQKLNELIKMC